MDQEQLLDIDYFRSFGVDPAYFGLGFIQLKIKANSRVHFYHNDLPVLADEPHDHRYNFISYILQGKFSQSIYAFDQDPNGKYEMCWEDCNPEHKIIAPAAICGNIHEVMHCEFSAGDYYEIMADTLHTVKAQNNAITYLVRQPPHKDFAGVVRLIGGEKVCPFSQPIPVKQCWEMIEDMLPKKNIIGYHVRDIPRGEVGEANKIVEEAYEILDAHEQGIRIMTQIEMSDLYGALDRYREKYHPELTMDDLHAMYKITRRAFENGCRK